MIPLDIVAEEQRAKNFFKNEKHVEKLKTKGVQSPTKPEEWGAVKTKRIRKPRQKSLKEENLIAK